MGRRDVPVSGLACGRLPVPHLLEKAGLVRLLASLGLPASSLLFQARSRFLGAGLGPQDLLKAFLRLLVPSASGPHFLVGHGPSFSGPASPATSLLPCYSQTEPVWTPTPLSSLPCILHSDATAWKVPSSFSPGPPISHQPSADHHLPLEAFPDLSLPALSHSQSCVSFSSTRAHHLLIVCEPRGPSTSNQFCPGSQLTSRTPCVQGLACRSCHHPADE